MAQVNGEWDQEPSFALARVAEPPFFMDILCSAVFG